MGRVLRIRTTVLLLGSVIGVSACLADSGAPSPTALPSPTAAVFTSPYYAYSVLPPTGWRAEAATEAWNGTDYFGDSTPTSDKFFFTSGDEIWAVAAPTTSSLDTMIAVDVAAGTAGNGCSVPESDEPITVGGEDGRLIVRHCPPGDVGAMIATAFVIHDGLGYSFYMIHPTGLASEASLDPFDSWVSHVPVAEPLACVARARAAASWRRWDSELQPLASPPRAVARARAAASCRSTKPRDGDFGPYNSVTCRRTTAKVASPSALWPLANWKTPRARSNSGCCDRKPMRRCRLPR